MRIDQISGVLSQQALFFSEIMSYNFNGKCQYQDYRDGYYWDRGWIVNGADPNTAGEMSSPRLTVKEQSATQEDNCICRRLQLSLQVEDCMECREQGGILPDPVILLWRYIQSLEGLKFYEVNSDAMWLDPRRADFLRSQGELVLERHDMGIFPIQLTRRETIGKPVDDTARAEIILCFGGEAHQLYELELPPEMATAGCTNC